MLISTFELMALFPNKDISTITNEDILKKRKEYYNSIENKSNNDFSTYKEIGILTDEYGNERVGIIEKTGFEQEGG